MTAMCLMLLRRGEEVLLGEKLTGFGTGKVVAPGGHVEVGESACDAAIRETREETGLLVSAAGWCADLTFAFPARPRWDLRLEVFTGSAFSGEMCASSELAPWWCSIAALPLARMWDDDRYWLERVLAGERLRGHFVYADDNTTVVQATLATV